jgi:hypothetical protein
VFASRPNLIIPSQFNAVRDLGSVNISGTTAYSPQWAGPAPKVLSTLGQLSAAGLFNVVAAIPEITAPSTTSACVLVQILANRKCN